MMEWKGLGFHVNLIFHHIEKRKIVRWKIIQHTIRRLSWWSDVKISIENSSFKLHAMPMKFSCRKFSRLWGSLKARRVNSASNSYLKVDEEKSRWLAKRSGENWILDEYLHFLWHKILYKKLIRVKFHLFERNSDIETRDGNNWNSHITQHEKSRWNTWKYLHWCNLKGKSEKKEKWTTIFKIVKSDFEKKKKKQQK